MRLIDADKGLRSKIQLETGCNFATADRIVESRPTVEAIPLARIKEAREELNEEYREYVDYMNEYNSGFNSGIMTALNILDKLIAEVEGQHEFTR